MADPWATLGLAPGAPPAVVRARWRALAKRHHPDLHSGVDATTRDDHGRRLAEVNEAYRRLAGAPAAGPAPEPPRPGWSAAGSGGTGSTPAGGPGAGVRATTSAGFAVEDFRPVVFEALVLASAELGEVTYADEPFALDVFVVGPPRGFCHIELVPEAGGSVVSLDSDQVDVDLVAGVLSAGLAAQGFAVAASGP